MDDAGARAPSVVIFVEHRRDVAHEHVRRARSNHLREGRDRLGHLRAELGEVRHLPLAAQPLATNPAKSARLSSGPRRGSGWTRKRVHRARETIRARRPRCGETRGGAEASIASAGLLATRAGSLCGVSKSNFHKNGNAIGPRPRKAPLSTRADDAIHSNPASSTQMSCQTARVPAAAIKSASAARRGGRVAPAASARDDVAHAHHHHHHRAATDRPVDWRSRVAAVGAALALACTPLTPALADDAADLAAPVTDAEEAGAPSNPGPVDEPEPVEMAFDDVEVGQAPDIDAQLARDAAQKSAGLTDLDQKAVDNNLKIKQYNNAPADFPTFVREGYDVRVITPTGYVTQDDGLVYKDFKVGEGKLPEDGQEVTFNYVAYNENGGTIDSTYRKGVPASTRLGINGMIPGFEEALKGMRAGGSRRVVVPPELGPPVGPATFFSSKQWEVFDIELIKVKSCERQQTGFMTSTVVCTD